MIKTEIRSLVLNSLAKYDSTNKFHPRFLDAMIEKTLNEMYTEVFMANPLNLQRYTCEYGYLVPLAVLLEVTSGIYYTTLPKNIVSFNDKATGVRRVAPATQTGIKFYPMDAREWDLAMGGSFVNYVKNIIGYIVNSARVEYYGMTGAVITSGVRMDIVIPFSEYTDTDVVLIPEHLDGEGKGLIDRVVAKLINIPPIDLKDDNKEKEE